MGQTQETDIILPNAGGPQVRLLQVTTLVGNVPTTVLMQVIQVSDEYGNPLSITEKNDTQTLMLLELRAIRLGIQVLIGTGIPGQEEDDLIELARQYDADAVDDFPGTN